MRNTQNFKNNVQFLQTVIFSKKIMGLPGDMCADVVDGVPAEDRSGEGDRRAAPLPTAPLQRTGTQVD